MRRHDRSPLQSPSRKRQKLLSSPAYGDIDLSQDDLHAIDEIEFRLSQSNQFSSCSQGSAASQHISSATNDALIHHNSSDNPFHVDARASSSSPPLPQRKTSELSGFTAASAIPINADNTNDWDRSPSPNPPSEKDYSSWFESAPVPEIAGFQTAKFTSASAISSASSFFSASSVQHNGQVPIVGFRTGTGKGVLAPSETALAKAREKMRDLWEENTSFPNRASDEGASKEAISLPLDSPQRTPFRQLENNISDPDTPCPSGSGFSSASAVQSLGFAKASGSNTKNQTPAFTSPLLGKTRTQNHDPNRPKPFKPPLLATPNARVPTTPARPSSSFVSARSQHPLAASPVNAVLQTPVRSTISAPSTTSPDFLNLPSSVFAVTPVSLDNIAKITPARFVTPFKKGMKPGDPSREKSLEEQKRKQQEREAEKQKIWERDRLSSDHDVWGDPIPKPTPEEDIVPIYVGPRKLASVFDMTPPPNRKTLLESGFIPQRYTASELVRWGIEVEELAQVTPASARYYSFYTYLPSPPCSAPAPFSLATEGSLAVQDALHKMIMQGCPKATKPWVDNAWSLILWKLAGMVAMDPITENAIPEDEMEDCMIEEKKADDAKKAGQEKQGPRWCWNEVWRQLMYRYEREINLGVRPPFRLITTRDHAASAPMVLCISNIIYPEPSRTADGRRIEPSPELEVTDGWYRLKAEIDPPMARAVKRGLMKVGRKIAVVGARLFAERKEPQEPLEAYSSNKLILNGNSCHLAPWHAKLGFQRGPYVSTMRSLTPDGGIVTTMDLVVLKVHRVAFLEIRVDENGKKIQEGPRTEADEATCKREWSKKRETAESKLREEHEKKVARYLSYAERLEQKAPHLASDIGDEPPDTIDSLYDELEEPDDAGKAISRTKGREAAWLARYIRERLQKDQDSVRDQMEKELNDMCPPRNIRSFRVIVVQDARVTNYPANRTAQLTIWDVLDLQLCEGKPRGHFEAGWRCLVTNLTPSQKTAWMGHEPGSEIFLVSSRMSRWQKLKSLD